MEEVSLPLSELAGGSIRDAAGGGTGQQPRGLGEGETSTDYGHDDRILLLTGSVMPAHYYYKAQKIRELIRQQVLSAMSNYDALVFPTSGRTAQPVQDDPPVTSKATTSRLPFLFTRLFNLASLPRHVRPLRVLMTNGMPVGTADRRPPHSPKKPCSESVTPTSNPPTGTPSGQRQWHKPKFSISLGQDKGLRS